MKLALRLLQTRRKKVHERQRYSTWDRVIIRSDDYVPVGALKRRLENAPAADRVHRILLGTPDIRRREGAVGYEVRWGAALERWGPDKARPEELDAEHVAPQNGRPVAQPRPVAELWADVEEAGSVTLGVTVTIERADLRRALAGLLPSPGAAPDPSQLREMVREQLRALLYSAAPPPSPPPEPLPLPPATEAPKVETPATAAAGPGDLRREAEERHLQQRDPRPPRKKELPELIKQAVLEVAEVGPEALKEKRKFSDNSRALWPKWAWIMLMESMTTLAQRDISRLVGHTDAYVAGTNRRIKPLYQKTPEFRSLVDRVRNRVLQLKQEQSLAAAG